MEALVCTQQKARPLPEHSCQLSGELLGLVRYEKLQNGIYQEFIPANKKANVCSAAHEFMIDMSPHGSLVCVKYCLKKKNQS